MRNVNSHQILRNPLRIDMQVACPSCSARAMAFQDGSILCIAEGASFAPEAADANHSIYGQLLRLRAKFDKENGISIEDRLLVLNKV